MTNRPHIMGIATFALALSVAVQPAAAQQQSQQQSQQPASSRVPVSVLERYTGEWVYPDGNAISVVLREGVLFRETGAQRVAFVPISDTKFRIGYVFTAEFVSDASGGMTQILTDGVGVEFRLRRRESLALPPSTAKMTSVRVPRTVLERYVGTYEYIPGQMSRKDLRIVVRLHGDTLTRDMGGETILFPLSETRFRVGDTGLIVEFVVDDAGVTQVLGSGFQQMLARLTGKP